MFYITSNKKEIKPNFILWINPCLGVTTHPGLLFLNISRLLHHGQCIKESETSASFQTDQMDESRWQSLEKSPPSPCPSGPGVEECEGH